MTKPSKRSKSTVRKAKSAPRRKRRRASGLLTRREVAAHFGVHQMTVTKWEQDGMPVHERGSRGRPSLYRLDAAIEWKSARDAAAQTRPGIVDVAAERARKERAQAELTEQTVKVRGRELLPAGEVERAWNAEVQAVRAAIMAAYTTSADRVYRAATLEGVAGVERELKDIGHAVLRELAERVDDSTAEGEHAA